VQISGFQASNLSRELACEELEGLVLGFLSGYYRTLGIHIVRADEFYSFLFDNMTKSSVTRDRLGGCVFVALS
jgi:hypothetical protein